MAVPPKRNHRGDLVGRERVAKRGPRGGLTRRPGRRRTRSRRRLAAPLTSVRRVRCSPAAYAATPISATTPAATTTRRPSRQGESHWCGSPVRFRVRRTPPRHPPRGPPKSRQRRSQRHPAGRFEAPRGGVARVLTKASVQVATIPGGAEAGSSGASARPLAAPFARTKTECNGEPDTESDCRDQAG